MFRCLQSSSVLLANIREFCSDYLRMTGPECSRSLRMRPEGRSEQNDAHTAFDVQVCHFHAGPDNDCGAACSDFRSRSGVRISSVQIIYRETGVTGRFAVKLRRRRAEPGAGATPPHPRERRVNGIASGSRVGGPRHPYQPPTLRPMACSSQGRGAGRTDLKATASARAARRHLAEREPQPGRGTR